MNPLKPKNKPAIFFDKTAYFLIFFVYLGFYVITCCKGITWIDPALHAHFVHKLSFSTWVNNHNLYILLGRLWTNLVPIGDLAYRLNLFSALCGTITVYFIFLAGIEITKNRFASLFGSLALMLSHSLWWHSTTIEVYTLNTALLALMIYFITRFNRKKQAKELLFASFFFGLACSNHVLMWLFIFSFIAILLLLHSQEYRAIPVGKKTIFYMILCFFAGFMLYIFIFIEDFYATFLTLQVQTPIIARTIKSFATISHDATGGFFKRMMFPTYNLPLIKVIKIYLNWHLNYLFLLVMNYPSVALPLGIVGLFGFWKRKDSHIPFWFVWLGLVSNTIWVVNYHIWDQYAFALPTWTIFGLFVIVGFDYLWRKLKSIRPILTFSIVTLIFGPYLYANIPRWAKHQGFWNKYFKFFHYTSNIWNAAEYLGNPNKYNYNLTTRIAKSIFNKLPEGAVFYDSDGKGWYPLKGYFTNIYNIRPDIKYHTIFGPTVTEKEAYEHAKRIVTQLAEGKEVFISSLYWPEQLIIRHLFLISEDKSSQAYLTALYELEIDELIGMFRFYKFHKILLLEGEEYCIYQIKKKTP